MDIESSAYAGGNISDAGVSNMGSLLLYSERTAGSRPIWGTDINVQCHNTNQNCTGVEVNMVNQGAPDDAGSTFRWHDLPASKSSSLGGKILGAGITVQGTGAFWKSGVYPINTSQVGCYSDTGIIRDDLHLATHLPGERQIYSIVPFADDTNPEILGRNAAKLSAIQVTRQFRILCC